MSGVKKNQLPTIVIGIVSLIGVIYFFTQYVYFGIIAFAINIVITACHILVNSKDDPYREKIKKEN